MSIATIDDQKVKNHCSGTLISKNFVLTAAHCFDNVKIESLILKHIGRKWCSIPLDFRAELILKSAEMTEIGKTLVSPSQLICMDSKTRDILSISVISADLRIKSARKSSGMEHHLRPLCCSIHVYFISGRRRVCCVNIWIFMDRELLKSRKVKQNLLGQGFEASREKIFFCVHFTSWDLDFQFF